MAKRLKPYDTRTPQAHRGVVKTEIEPLWSIEDMLPIVKRGEFAVDFPDIRSAKQLFLFRKHLRSIGARSLNGGRDPVSKTAILNFPDERSAVLAKLAECESSIV